MFFRKLAVFFHNLFTHHRIIVYSDGHSETVWIKCAAFILHVGTSMYRDRLQSDRYYCLRTEWAGVYSSPDIDIINGSNRLATIVYSHKPSFFKKLLIAWGASLFFIQNKLSISFKTNPRLFQYAGISGGCYVACYVTIHIKEKAPAGRSPDGHQSDKIKRIFSYRLGREQHFLCSIASSRPKMTTP